MKKLLAILLLTLSMNALAFDANKSWIVYNDFKTKLNTEKQARSAGNMILEGVIAFGSIGTYVVDRQFTGASISRSVINSISTRLYESADFGLYTFQGHKVSVWYERDMASVVSLTVYSDQ